MYGNLHLWYIILDCAAFKNQLCIKNNYLPFTYNRKAYFNIHRRDVIKRTEEETPASIPNKEPAKRWLSLNKNSSQRAFLSSLKKTSYTVEQKLESNCTKICKENGCLVPASSHAPNCHCSVPRGDSWVRKWLPLATIQ